MADALLRFLAPLVPCLDQNNLSPTSASTIVHWSPLPTTAPTYLYPPLTKNSQKLLEFFKNVIFVTNFLWEKAHLKTFLFLFPLSDGKIAGVSSMSRSLQGRVITFEDPLCPPSPNGFWSLLKPKSDPRWPFCIAFSVRGLVRPTVANSFALRHACDRLSGLVLQIWMKYEVEC